MTQFLRDDFDRLHDYNCLISSRFVYFGSEYVEEDEEGGVDCYSVGKCIKNLMYLDQKARTPITLHYNSPGGDWDRGIALHDCILGLRSPVRFVGYGCVRSMGTVIAQACAKRYLTPHTRFMIHVGTSAHYGHTEDHIRDGKEAEVICQQMYDVYYKRMKEVNPNITMAKIRKLCSHDTYMSGEKAVELGLADAVVGVDDE